MGDRPSRPMRVQGCQVARVIFFHFLLPLSANCQLNDLATPLQNQVAGWPAYQSRVIRRGNASLAFGKVSVSTPLSSCALILSRSILFESVNPRV